MKNPFFRSCLAPHMERFVALRQASGFDYRGQAKELRYFDTFLFRNDLHVERLTRDLTEDYERSLRPLHPATRENRLRVLILFARHLTGADPESFVPWAPPSDRAARARLPFIYTLEHIRALMQAAGRLLPAPSLRPHTYGALIGLLYSTGLRISEALALDLGDLDHDAKLLHVRHGKFGKERWVPLSDSAYGGLRAYLDRRMGTGPPEPGAPLLISLRGRRLNYSTVLHTYQRLLAVCGLRPAKGPRPRIHDVRHTFAVHSLLRWYRQGRDINACLPALSTYMGHVGLEATLVYLHATAELLDETHRRFLTHYRQYAQGDFDDRHASDRSVHGTVLLPVSRR
jgi:integrase